MSYKNTAKFKLGEWVKVRNRDFVGKIVGFSKDHYSYSYSYTITHRDGKVVLVQERDLELATEEEAALWILQN